MPKTAPGMMKIYFSSSRLVIVDCRWDAGRFFSGALSPRDSLARTSFRTLNCCPRRRGARGAECFCMGCPPAAGFFREIAMETIFENVAGLDVHQKTIVACVRKFQPQGGGIAEEDQTFGTMTGDLLQLSD